MYIHLCYEVEISFLHEIRQKYQVILGGGLLLRTLQWPFKHSQILQLKAKGSLLPLNLHSDLSELTTMLLSTPSVYMHNGVKL